MRVTPRRVSMVAIAACVAALVTSAGPAAAPAAASACAHTHSSPSKVGTKKVGRAIICLLDRRRRAHGLGGLDSNADLRRAARAHSRRMDGTGCFDHECPGEPSIEKRLLDVHYLLHGLLQWSYGENIAWGSGGYETPAKIVNAWMHSPPHRENILNGGFRDIGVGVAVGTPSSRHADGGIYTTDFGFRRR